VAWRIYEVTLLALAETGPKAVVSYEELRSSMNGLLSDKMPQKHEITSALKHLAIIAMKEGRDTAIDWDDGKREINVADPYLRFYLRWQGVALNEADAPFLRVKRGLARTQRAHRGVVTEAESAFDFIRHRGFQISQLPATLPIVVKT